MLAKALRAAKLIAEERKNTPYHIILLRQIDDVLHITSINAHTCCWTQLESQLFPNNWQIMVHKTEVSAFMKQYPTVVALAQAEASELIYNSPVSPMIVEEHAHICQGITSGDTSSAAQNFPRYMPLDGLAMAHAVFKTMYGKDAAEIMRLQYWTNSSKSFPLSRGWLVEYQYTKVFMADVAETA